MTRKWIVGNWKMNGSLSANQDLLHAIHAGLSTASCQAAVCVPAPYLAQVQQQLLGSALWWGAQDVSAHEQGAFTGEVSAAMLRDFGVRVAIVGHSERRQYHGETDAVVATKAQRALAAGITPIVCVVKPWLSVKQAKPRRWSNVSWRRSFTPTVIASAKS